MTTETNQAEIANNQKKITDLKAAINDRLNDNISMAGKINTNLLLNKKDVMNIEWLDNENKLWEALDKAPEPTEVRKRKVNKFKDAAPVDMPKSIHTGS